MLAARHSGQHPWVIDRRVVKCNLCRIDPMADDPMRLSCMGERDHCHYQQPSWPTGDALVPGQDSTSPLVPPSPGGACHSVVCEHEDLMPHLIKAGARPAQADARRSAQGHGSWWTIDNTVIAAEEGDQLVRNYADAGKVNQIGI